MPNSKLIGENIKKYRKQNNLTQKQLALLIDKTESSIQKYESGKVDIPNNVLHCIAQQLNCSFTDLIGIDTDVFMTRLRHGNSDPFLIFLDSLGYKVTLGGNGGLYINISGQTIPLIRSQYDSLKELVTSYTKFTAEQTLFYQETKPPTTE